MSLNKDYLGNLADYIEAVEEAGRSSDLSLDGSIDVTDVDGNRLGTLNFSFTVETTFQA